MGGLISKNFLEIRHKPILAYTLAVFQAHPLIAQIVLALREEDIPWCKEHVVQRFGFNKAVHFVRGGAKRQDSVLQGLLALESMPELVLIHDGARPLVDGDILDRTIESGRNKGSGVAGVPVKDTIKRLDAQGRVLETLNRDVLWQIQTPQVFPGAALVEAYLEGCRRGDVVTDDAALMEKNGYPVHVVWGSYDNIKITTPEDLIFAEEILKQRALLDERTGS
jgi:2-C-methyl-D-erythritol 4-phosphate cytidylyltransferase